MSVVCLRNKKKYFSYLPCGPHKFAFLKVVSRNFIQNLDLVIPIITRYVISEYEFTSQSTFVNLSQ